MNTKNTHSNGAQPPHWLSEEDRVTRFTIKTLNPAGVLGFSPICVTANETDRVATITVHRRQGGDGEVTVDYFSTDGTARSNVNYAPVSGTLTFPPSVTYQTFTVSLADDGVANSPLTIHLVDLMAQMGKNLTGVLKDDPQLAVFRFTDFIEEMVKRGWWGEKKGQGFYKRIKTESAGKGIFPKRFDLKVSNCGHSVAKLRRMHRCVHSSPPGSPTGLRNKARSCPAQRAKVNLARNSLPNSSTFFRGTLIKVPAATALSPYFDVALFGRRPNDVLAYKK